MGDSACLMHGFSYASPIPNTSKQGNPMHSLGESVSFGRFMTESLSWDKWSTFPHKKYVEEAERYTQPGSVAEKKAFFEAHYKRIAAQKAAAAALLEQENAAKREAELLSRNNAYDQQLDILSSYPDDVKIEAVEVQETIEIEKAAITVNEALEESPVKRDSISQIDENTETQGKISVSESSETPQIERPLLKNCVASEDMPSVTSKKKSSLSSLKSTIQRKTWKIPSTPAKPVTPHYNKEAKPFTPHYNKENNVTRKSSVDRKTFSPKSLRALMELLPTKRSDKAPTAATKKSETPRIPRGFSRTPKDCATPLRTPAAKKSLSTYPAAITPLSENRMKTPVNSSAMGSKTSGPKWHLLSSVCAKSLTACRNKLQSPTLSTPFILRTEERAAKRKQKLEEKFNANEVQKTQVQKTLKEKAGNEFSKLGCGFCFKARPLPDFYKEREFTRTQMKKIPAAKPQSVVLGRSISSKKQGNISMPPPPPPPKSLPKNGATKNLSRKNAPNPS